LAIPDLSRLEGQVKLTFYALGESGAPCGRRLPRDPGWSVIRDLRVVDPERLRAIPESLRTEWHANGWLAALEAHVAPARNWEPLLAYEDEKSATLVQPRDPATPL
jgi:hypothetical protein